jgi:hypothetical protein
MASFRLVVSEVMDVSNQNLWAKVFRVQPVTSILFTDGFQSCEFAESLRKSFSGKCWKEISLDDWINVADIETIAQVMTPESFFYYLPSILIHAFLHADYNDWGVRALLPHNQDRIEKGDWWKRFVQLFSREQKVLVCGYLSALEKVSHEDDYSQRFLVAKAIEIYRCSREAKGDNFPPLSNEQ